MRRGKRWGSGVWGARRLCYSGLRVRVQPGPVEKLDLSFSSQPGREVFLV
jgi:hypothetical protein